MDQPNSQTQFFVRLFNPEFDIPGLVTLRTEIEAVDQVGTNTSEAAVKAQMKWLGHDPLKDRWVAVSPDAPNKFIGHAWIFAQSPKRSILSVSVHPAWRHKGLGSSLLDHALIGAVQVVSGTEANNVTGDAFLKHHGFSAVGHTRFLFAPENFTSLQSKWPAGYTVHNFAEINDLSILVMACNRCYKDMWGHRENTEPSTEEFYNDLMKQYPDLFPPGGVFLILAPDKTVAGVCFCRVEDGQKVIDSPAIIPEHRQPDLLRSLVLTAMRWLNAQAQGGIQLQTWGDSECAVEIYHELGFTLDDKNHSIEYIWNGNLSDV
jgi:ribosomal protein S18 acetylase RimI-like enzyme